MTNFTLVEFNHSTLRSIQGKIEKDKNLLDLTWILKGDLSPIIISTKTLSAYRKQNLWQETCFEVFLKQLETNSYFEYNFSTTLDWNCYSFSSYRKGMREAEVVTPEIFTELGSENLTLSAKIKLPLTIGRASSLCLNLSAIIKMQNDKREYWALSHPSEEPDFHHPQGFLLKL